MRTPDPADPLAPLAPPDLADPPERELWRGAALPDSELIHRWHGALHAAGHQRVAGGLATGRLVLDRWREPHRRYHDLEHLSEVLIALDLLSAPPGVAQLAAFFHDAVYQAGPGDEQRSAALARDLLGPLLPPEPVSTVVAAVLATYDHTASTPEEQLLNDADLAILAAPEVRYTRYCAGVRAEYAAYSDAEFTAGRRAVLTDLLNRPRLFGTDAAYRRWERRARANLTAELSGHGLP